MDHTPHPPSSTTSESIFGKSSHFSQPSQQPLSPGLPRISLMSAGNFWGVVCLILTLMGVWLILHLVIYRRWLRSRPADSKFKTKRSEYKKQTTTCQVFVEEDSPSKIPPSTIRGLKDKGEGSLNNMLVSNMDKSYKEGSTIPGTNEHSRFNEVQLQLRGDVDDMRGGTYIQRDITEIEIEEDQKEEKKDSELRVTEMFQSAANETFFHSEDEKENSMIEEEEEEEESDQEVSMPNIDSERVQKKGQIRVVKTELKLEQRHAELKRIQSS